MNIDSAVLSTPTSHVKPNETASTESRATNDFAEMFQQHMNTAKTAKAFVNVEQLGNQKLALDDGHHEVSEVLEWLPEPAGAADQALASLTAAWPDAFKSVKQKPGEFEIDGDLNWTDGAFSGLPGAIPVITAGAEPAKIDSVATETTLSNIRATFLDASTVAKDAGTAVSTVEPLVEEPLSGDSVPVSEPDLFATHLQASKEVVSTPTETISIAKPLTHPGWNKDLGEQIVWLCQKNLSSADITLNPQHLGPISVRISMDQDQASVLFTTPHAAVKEALDASIPKLREMLGSQQVNLLDVNVSQQSTSDHGSASLGHGQTGSGQSNNRHSTENSGVEVEQSLPEQAIVTKGLLSLYA